MPSREELARECVCLPRVEHQLRKASSLESLGTKRQLSYGKVQNSVYVWNKPSELEADVACHGSRNRIETMTGGNNAAMDAFFGVYFYPKIQRSEAIVSWQCRSTSPAARGGSDEYFLCPFHSMT